MKNSIQGGGKPAPSFPPPGWRGSRRAGRARPGEQQAPAVRAMQASRPLPRPVTAAGARPGWGAHVSCRGSPGGRGRCAGAGFTCCRCRCLLGHEDRAEPVPPRLPPSACLSVLLGPPPGPARQPAREAGPGRGRGSGKGEGDGLSRAPTPVPPPPPAAARRRPAAAAYTAGPRQLAASAGGLRPPRALSAGRGDPPRPDCDGSAAAPPLRLKKNHPQRPRGGGGGSCATGPLCVHPCPLLASRVGVQVPSSICPLPARQWRGVSRANRSPYTPCLGNGLGW